MDDGGSKTQGGVSAKLTVTLTVDENGGLWSSHDASSDEDRKTLAEWPGGGLRHIVHGLLTETVRREAFLLSLMEMSQDKEYRGRFQAANEAERQKMAEVIGTKVVTQLKDTLPKLAPQSAREMLEMIANQG